MFASYSSGFGAVIPSVALGTRPATNWGASITPGNNTYGSYTSVQSAHTEDAYGILININSNNVSAAARDALVTIGFDPAGGTSFGGLGGVAGNEINHLVASCAVAYLLGSAANTGGIWYYFPLFIKAGTSIGAKASINNATVGTLRVATWLMTRPTNPKTLRCGSFVRTFGATTASSSGTAITPGTTTKATYTQVGSAIAEPLWFWELGIGMNNATMPNNIYHCDLAVGSSTSANQTVIQDAFVAISSTEAIGKPVAGAYWQAAVGDNVYVRAQGGPNALDIGYSMIAYGVGG